MVNLNDMKLIIEYALKGRPIMYNISFTQEENNIVFDIKDGLMLNCTFPANFTMKDLHEGTIQII